MLWYKVKHCLIVLVLECHVGVLSGLGSEDKLIAAAKQVASSTAHLLVACKVKAEGDTEATRRLHAAGNAVIRSTDSLVRAAQQAKQVEEERLAFPFKKNSLRNNAFFFQGT